MNRAGRLAGQASGREDPGREDPGVSVLLVAEPVDGLCVPVPLV